MTRLRTETSIPATRAGVSSVPTASSSARGDDASTNARAVARELRDGLLQDLVALGLVLRLADRSLAGARAEEARATVRAAGSTVARDLERLRSVIDRLGGCG